MEIGKLLKKYRMKRNLTQQEMAQSIISTSYYSKVEKGIHRINVEDLLNILAINEIDIFSFISEISPHNHTTLTEQIQQDLLAAYYEKNLERIEQIQLEISHKKLLDKDKKFFLLFAESLKFSMNDTEQLLDEQSKKYLQNTVFNIEEWHYSKLSLYCNLIEYYDFESNLFMVHSILQNGLKKYHGEEKLIVMNIILNFVGLCMKQKKDEVALSYLVLMMEEKTFPENFFQKLLGKLYFELLIYRRNPSKESEEKIEHILAMIAYNDMGTYSDEFNQFYQQEKEMS
ncbi:helix-turn-helix domain-containing protein [Isobaculum melis]|uniref:Transcriptional activator, Rgg/GadR/MutR family, C-terminal domain-containing protein n=1 Tax=Isobaculum melis TaxID=142588 RepID=A0A1H9QU60_9LACT|nr:Rgg/GadR/MutR family transcriptional regulator [Isobaculum melis]SER63970.1 transcriptional activator, Rgg/GadR/MutR family, C-terminal domain-containing protein [Isobaculum melis]